MGWQAVELVSARARPAIVAVSLFKPPSQDRIGLRMRLGRDPVEAAGFVARQTVAVLWGDGADVGKVLLRVDPAGRSLLKVPGASRTGALECLTWLLPPDALPGLDGERWSLAREVRKSAEGPWRVADGGLVVGLPAEWWIVEAKGAAASAAVPGRAPIAAPAAVAGRTRDPLLGGGPRSDPHDPKLQEMAAALLARGCALPELRLRLRLDETDFKILCEQMRRSAAAKPRPPAPGPKVDAKAELARIVRAAEPPPRAAR